ncbi:cation-translocating P-type ATPase [Amorphoplanes digitatis]|uniref:Ca2+-transporting ATPase n=1 Tax=Actinoplanes digitatis TaxID=1868 RepID=A0A7W7HY61_9ACTN|nr:cation-transporting P-type ATPase [Actinoplanes digitatis]MBB4762959.1 Ca2+-transporting ATPase [Actinoplanes digitatis]GID91548.1 ATPase [Actinoplanes digitatis]
MHTTAPAPARGLTTVEAGARLTADGPNLVAAPAPRHLLGRIGRQLADPLVALLIAAAVVTTLLGDLPDTAVIVLVVTINTLIGVVQETRADAAIAALDQLAAPTARVVRDGHDQILAAADLVRGDLVRLEAGDIVPADLRLAEAMRATFDESSLTGESVPVHHDPGAEAAAGTVLTTGRAAGVVVRTGAASSLGAITELVAHTKPGPTPLQRRISGLGRALGVTAVAVSGVVFALGVLAGQPIARMAVAAVSLVVAAVPESLPAVVTLTLALGARRMAQTQAIPRRLHAVETLGSVTVIASDKTGTLTENRMSVQQAVTADGLDYTVTGTGYRPAGEIRQHGQITPIPGELRSLARAGLLCNDAELMAPEPGRTEWAAAGDPMEAALVAFAARCGLDTAAERAAAPRVGEQPFDQATRSMTTVHRQETGGYLVVRKGAPESLLAPRADAALLDAAAELATGGLRVLAVATAVTTARPDPADPPPLRTAGLLGIGDPLRATARDTAAAFARSGVRLVLITGDHPATAAAIGTDLGLMGPDDTVVRGDEGSLGADDLDHARVYARTQPEQKLDIIAGLRQRGEVVAMTGDGVNDAPALRRADIGVAMGGGTEVARQAAELVLVDDNLATVADAIGEGRRIYDNIRRFLRYALSGGIAELLVMLGGPLLGMPLALLPGQLLWINLLTHGVPGVALGAEPAEADVLDRRPRSPQESVLGDGLLRSVLAGGLCLATVVLAAGVTAHRLDRPWQSVMFMVLGLAQLGVALAVRARGVPGAGRNWSLLAAVAISAVLQVAGVLLAPLRALLGTEALTAPELLACAVVAVLPGLALRLVHRRAQRDLRPVRG